MYVSPKLRKSATIFSHMFYLFTILSMVVCIKWINEELIKKKCLSSAVKNIFCIWEEYVCACESSNLCPQIFINLRKILNCFIDKISNWTIDKVHKHRLGNKSWDESRRRYYVKKNEDIMGRRRKILWEQRGR